MKRFCLLLLFVVLVGLDCFAQEAGNRIYRGQQNRRVSPNTGVVSGTENKTETPVQYIEAYVLLNAPPDEFVAVFGVAQEAEGAVESNQKVNTLIDNFINATGKLGVKRNDIYVDLITQNRVYNLVPATGNTVREKLSGFETKKTVAVRYKDRELLEKILAAAAGASIFDLIKVDYVVKDMEAIHTRLFEQASQVIKSKEDNYNRLLNFKLKRAGIVTDKYTTFYPSELYQTYTAYESGTVENNYESSTRVIRERKSSSSFLEPLDSSEFDAVINPLGIEPMVQCTLYLKVKFNPATNVAP